MPIRKCFFQLNESEILYASHFKECCNIIIRHEDDDNEYFVSLEVDELKEFINELNNILIEQESYVNSLKKSQNGKG